MLDVKKAILRDEKRKARQRQRYNEDPQYRDHVLAYKRAWDKANPDKIRSYNEKRAQTKKKTAAKAGSKNKAG